MAAFNPGEGDLELKNDELNEQSSASGEDIYNFDTGKDGPSRPDALHQMYLFPFTNEWVAGARDQDGDQAKAASASIAHPGPRTFVVGFPKNEFDPDDVRVQSRELIVHAVDEGQRITVRERLQLVPPKNSEQEKDRQNRLPPGDLPVSAHMLRVWTNPRDNDIYVEQMLDIDLMPHSSPDIYHNNGAADRPSGDNTDVNIPPDAAVIGQPPPMQDMVDTRAPAEADTTRNVAILPIDRGSADRTELAAARTELRQALAQYAGITAVRRMTHHDLLEGNRLTTWINKRVRPAAYLKAERERGQLKAVQERYRTAVDGYIGVVAPNDPSAQEDMRQRMVLLFEGLVVRYRRGYGLGPSTRSTPTPRASDPNADTMPLPPATIQVPLKPNVAPGMWAKLWTGNPVEKAVVRGGAHAIGGFVLGVVSASISTAPPVTIGVGAVSVGVGAASGYVIGRSVNQNLAKTESGLQEIKSRRESVLSTLQTDDIIEKHEAITRAEREANRRRIRVAAFLGAVGVAAGFAGGTAIAEAIKASAAHSVAPRLTSPHTSSGAGTSGAGTASSSSGASSGTSGSGMPVRPRLTTELNKLKQSGASLNSYPWTVANILHPGHGMDIVAKTAKQLHLQLVQHGKYIWVQNGTHALTKAQQAAFNMYTLLLNS